MLDYDATCNNHNPIIHKPSGCAQYRYTLGIPQNCKFRGTIMIQEWIKQLKMGTAFSGQSQFEDLWCLEIRHSCHGRSFGRRYDKICRLLNKRHSRRMSPLDGCELIDLFGAGSLTRKQDIFFWYLQHPATSCNTLIWMGQWLQYLIMDGPMGHDMSWPKLVYSVFLFGWFPSPTIHRGKRARAWRRYLGEANHMGSGDGWWWMVMDGDGWWLMVDCDARVPADSRTCQKLIETRCTAESFKHIPVEIVDLSIKN